MTTIFVVEDDDAVRDSLKILLESCGMDVEMYASIDSFVQNYRSRHPECLILDHNLEGSQTGLDFLNSGQRATIRLPVILVTGRGDAELKGSALRAGAAAYLEKPIDDGQLIAAIDAAIAAAP